MPGRASPVRSEHFVQEGYLAASGVIDRAGLDELISALRGDGYTTVGPTLRDGVILYDEITGTADLPIGWTDRQRPGGYRLEERGDDRLFGFVVGPRSWKRYLYPERSVVWAGQRNEDGWHDAPPAPAPRYAFIGARGCELAAIAIQDSVFMGEGRPVDPTYAGRRTQAFIVAVDCDEPGENCFCLSMGTGPSAGPGYDLALHELADGSDVRLLVTVGTERGEELLHRVSGLASVTDTDVTQAAEQMEHAATAMKHALDTEDIHDLLLGNLTHPHWADVAERCLACANCTLVCPTCFCSTVEDDMTLDGSEATRTRRWDSCFSADFSYIHGGPIRPGTASRYRQWLTHKLATWYDQFGVSGCVGCGRCITWCPVGIDLTAEVAAIRAADQRTGTPLTTPEVLK